MSVRETINHFGGNVKKHHLSAYAAQASLFIIMSIIPFLLVFVSLIRYTSITEQLVLQSLQRFFPGRIAPWLKNIIDEVYHHNQGKTLLFAVLFAVYSSAKSVHSLRNGLNVVYELNESRNWFKLRLRAMIETLALVFLVVLLLLFVVFSHKLERVIGGRSPQFAYFMSGVIRFRLLIMFFFLILIFSFIYKMLPNRVATIRSQILGAVVCSISWYIFSFGLSVVVNYFNGFSIYGSLTTVILVMFWLYFCMLIFLFCGEINNEIEIVLAALHSVRESKRKTKHRDIDLHEEIVVQEKKDEE